MSPQQHQTDAIAACRRAVLDRLAQLRSRMRGQLVMEACAWIVATLVLLAAFSLLFDRVARPDFNTRAVLLIVGVVLMIMIAIRRLTSPLLLRLDDLDLAELLERRMPGTGHRLANVLLLPNLSQRDPSASPAMIAAAVQQDFAELERVDLQAPLDKSRRQKSLIALVGLLALAIILCAANPAMASLWARRWFGGAEIRWPQRTYLTVVGLGDERIMQVPRGEATLLEISSQPEFTPQNGYWKLSGRGEPLLIEGRDTPVSANPESVLLKLQFADRSQRQGTFTQFAAGQFRYELPPLFDAAQVQVYGGDDWFGPLQIVPVDRPAVEIHSIKAQIPGREQPEVHSATEAEKQLLFLTGTRLEVQLASTQPVRTAKAIVSGTNTVIDLNSIGDQRFQLDWEMKDAVTFEFQLKGQNGLESKPYFLTFGLLNDRPPRLTLRSSGVGRRITPVAKIPLHVRAIDDFGIQKFALDMEETHLADAKPVTTTRQPLKEFFSPAAAALSLDVTRDPVMEIAEFNWNPGTALRIRAKGSDACQLGAQSAESRWISFQIVSSDELFYEILTRQREQRARFAKALEAAKELNETLAKFAKPSEAAAIIRGHQALTRQVWQIAGQLDATLTEMTLNDLGTAGARELLQTTVIQPMRELHDQPLASQLKTLTPLGQGDEVSEERRETAIEAQTEIVKRMQRILDQMSQWESFVDVVNQLRHVINSQSHIRDSTDEMQKQQLKDVFEE